MSCFVSCGKNNLDIKKYYNILRNGEITEASNINLFNNFPELQDIQDIEIGEDTANNIVRLKNNNFLVVGTKEIIKL